MIDLPWSDSRKKKFITNAGLISSKGKSGYNLMAAEWTHHVSYSPGLIMVCPGIKKKTAQNIKETGFFAVGLAAENQNTLASIAGNNSGHNLNKIEALKELGYKFFKGKKIDVLIPEGTAMQAECKVIKDFILGDHHAFVGKIIYLYPENNIKPLAYTQNKYFKIGKHIEKPNQKVLKKIAEVLEKHRK